MKVETNIQKLKTALIQADKITSKNASHPVLGAVLLTAKDGSLNIRSTNLSLGVDITIEAKVEKDGVVAVPGSLLVGVFSSLLGKKEVVLELVGDSLTVSSTGVNLLIKTVESEDFPSIPRIEGLAFEIPTETLLKGLKAVYYTAAVSDIKPEVSSVYVYPEDNDSLNFVATDTFRLAEKKLKLDDVPDFDGLLIPFKNISEILRVLGDHESEKVSIVFNKNQISFEVSNVYLTSRLVDGVFPDYRQILPKESKTSIIVLKQDLINALKLANVFGDKFQQVTVVVDPKAGVFELSSKNTTVGENNTTLEATLSGDPITLNINYKYLLDCFQSMYEDSVVIELTEANRPLVVKGVTDKSFLYLIMPMNR
jgi:DNA polymerase-3 subunit beta